MERGVGPNAPSVMRGSGSGGAKGDGKTGHYDLPPGSDVRMKSYPGRQSSWERKYYSGKY